MPIETTKFDTQDHLKTVEEQAAYLQTALEDGDPSFIATALGDIARAHGVTRFSRETGLSRETIYKTFRPGGNPTLDTLTKAAKALGFKLALVKAA